MGNAILERERSAQLNGRSKRDKIFDHLLRIPSGEGAALLIGGALMGKTTVLRRVAASFMSNRTDSRIDGAGTVPVYVDLRSISGFHARHFYKLLLHCVAGAVSKDRIGPTDIRLPTDGLDLDEFASRLDVLFSENPALSICFLLDNCDRLEEICEALPANIVWILWSEHSHAWKHRISFVFTGGQKTWSFLLDDKRNSALSRGAVLFLENVSFGELEQMAASETGLIDFEMAATDVYDATGGHPGLSRMLLTHLRKIDPSAYSDAISKFRNDKLPFFEALRKGLSGAGRRAQVLLHEQRSLTRAELFAESKSIGLDAFSIDAAIRELQFTGLTTMDGQRISPSCTLYWKYSRDVSEDDKAEPSDFSGTRYFLQKNGAAWIVAFGAKVVSLADSKGLHRLHRLISAGPRWLPANTLAAESERVVVSLDAREGADHGKVRSSAQRIGVNDQIDPETVADLQKQRVELERRLALLSEKPAMETTAAAVQRKNQRKAARKELDDIADYLREHTFKGKAKCDYGYRAAYNAVRKSLADCYAQIDQHSELEGMSDHLKKAIDYSRGDFAYIPRDPKPWRL